MAAIRIQKILAQAGLASRREAEEWIRAGRVQVNGQAAHLGDRADPAVDSVKLDGRRVAAPRGRKTYILLMKPRGYVTTVADPESRDTVMDLLPDRFRRIVKPVGRLDVQTEGLLLLTDDGDLARDVTHPSGGCAKEYRVKVSGVPPDNAVERLRRGITLDGRSTRSCTIDRTSTTAGRGEGNAWFRVVLGEGRSRQIRRMFEAIGHPVSKLKRVAIGPIRDERLPVGAFRMLSEAEVRALRDSLRRGERETGRRGESRRPSPRPGLGRPRRAK
jgi:23S rRNA pseudouridine2605 synthase